LNPIPSGDITRSPTFFLSETFDSKDIPTVIKENCAHIFPKGSNPSVRAGYLLRREKISSYFFNFFRRLCIDWSIKSSVSMSAVRMNPAIISASSVIIGRTFSSIIIALRLNGFFHIPKNCSKLSKRIRLRVFSDRFTNQIPNSARASGCWLRICDRRVRRRWQNLQETKVSGLTSPVLNPPIILTL
jgi:hypothetical protein